MFIFITFYKIFINHIQIDATCDNNALSYNSDAICTCSPLDIVISRYSYTGEFCTILADACADPDTAIVFCQGVYFYIYK